MNTRDERAIQVELIVGVIFLVVAVAYYAMTRDPMLAICLALTGLSGVII